VKAAVPEYAAPDICLQKRCPLHTLVGSLYMKEGLFFKEKRPRIGLKILDSQELLRYLRD
jgi:hypothetical protein